MCFCTDGLQPASSALPVPGAGGSSHHSAAPRAGFTLVQGDSRRIRNAEILGKSSLRFFRIGVILLAEGKTLVKWFQVYCFVLSAVPATSTAVPSSVLCLPGFAPQDSCSWGGRGRTPTLAAQFWFESPVAEHI